MGQPPRHQLFVLVCGAGILLIAIGTLTYSLAEGWRVVDGFYFVVSTLTTSSIADPDPGGRWRRGVGSRQESLLTDVTPEW